MTVSLLVLNSEDNFFLLCMISTAVSFLVYLLIDEPVGESETLLPR